MEAPLRELQLKIKQTEITIGLAPTDLDVDLLAGLVGGHPLALDGDHPLAAPGGGGGLAPRGAAAPASGLRGLARIVQG